MFRRALGGVALYLTVCMPLMAQELIVLASPPSDGYYAQVEDQIFDFHIRFAEQILEAGDDVLIFTDQDWYLDYVAELGSDQVVMAPQADIWMRDFSLSNANGPVMFRYTAAGQGGSQADADYVQDGFYRTAISAGLSFAETSLLNDGGNLVDDYQGRAVVSTKFLSDNKMSESQARGMLRVTLGTKEIAFLVSDEQGGLEHADGVVAFIDPNVLVVNDYSEDPAYASKLVSDLRRGLPEAQIHTIITPYDDRRVYDPKFGSACGLYTNMLVTPNRIYLPQFGIPEDSQALARIRSLTAKTVVPVQSSQVCHMGGGVRCMSWQLRGGNADRLKAWARSEAPSR